LNLLAELGDVPHTSEKTSSRGALDTLVDLGKGNWWDLAHWHASQTADELEDASMANLFSPTTRRMMTIEGCPNRACQRFIEGLMTLKTHLVVDCSKEGKV
jgi:hypothetical protein